MASIIDGIIGPAASWLGLTSTDSGTATPTSPYRSGWDALINQLKARANGPSMAEKQVRDVGAAGINQQVAVSHGRSAGAAREGSMGAAQITQGLEGKAVEARLAEQKQNDSTLQNALAGASGAQYNYDALAQNQAQFEASRPTQLQQLAGIAAQVGGAAAGAGAFAKGSPTGAAPSAPMPATLQGANYTDQGQPANAGMRETTMGGLDDDPYLKALRYRSPQYLTGQSDSPYGAKY